MKNLGVCPYMEKRMVCPCVENLIVCPYMKNLGVCPYMKNLVCVSICGKHSVSIHGKPRHVSIHGKNIGVFP